LKGIINNMKNYKIDKEREKLINNCKTILNDERLLDNLSRTDKNSFAEFTLRKNLNEENKKQHKKYYSCYEESKLIEGTNQNFHKNSISRNTNYESNKEFIENYTNYVRIYFSNKFKI